jgi:hypothetical protein
MKLADMRNLKSAQQELRFRVMLGSLYQVNHPVIQCKLDSPGSDRSRFRFVSLDALWASLFLSLAQNPAEARYAGVHVSLRHYCTLF